MAKFFILTALALFVAQALAVPAADPEERQVVHHCANGVDNCPAGPQWTCCGPIIEGVGGICRKLKPDQVCIF